MSKTLEEQMALEAAKTDKVKNQLVRDIAAGDKGMPTEGARAFAKEFGGKFEINGQGVVVHKKKGETVAEYIDRRRGKLNFYFGEPLDPGNVKDVDTQLVRDAFITNSKTARGKLVESVGKIRADELARAYGLSGILDFRVGTRPQPVKIEDAPKPNIGNVIHRPENDQLYKAFTRQGWNKSVQAQLHMTDPKRAARLMEAAGVSLGSTKPVK